ncbi:hypothetical protein I569_01140 [Enterococcus dispar ATCC 51266]|uniref:Integral membrane protein n=2 Tax=Enterococcus dispar TaxID=44009 RepID=S1NJE1_9ENTE|nr:hypothetical protein OMK_00062 [Enterococcus dispar ATCC 51266]EOW85823.1 hypothetical protein I569_01140 [Enterococcus dispar ATCC 51266]
MQMSKSNSNIKVLAVNAIVAALYVALSLITPFSAGPIQFRISESLNHLVVFNRKYLWGIFLGVVIYNALFGYGIMDVLFGGGQTLLALTLTSLLQNKVKDKKVLLGFNIAFFTFSMFLIAIMLMITADLPFWPTYLTTALSELIIMSISAPVMVWLNNRLHFNKQL